MALLKAFRALRYDPTVAGPLDALVAPPYDVIPEDELGQLAAVSPFNVVRLIRPHQPQLALERYTDWRERGVLARERTPAVWLLEESFVGPDGIARKRRGLVGRVRLEPFGAGIVYPHERTFEEPTASRLGLIETLGAKISPVLMLHSGEPPAQAPDRDPDLAATLEGATSRLWRLDDAEQIAEALARVSSPIVIADGHHRYTAALRHHERHGREETAYVLAALVSTRDPGLEIFPTHRLADEPPAIAGRELGPGRAPADLLAVLAAEPRDRPAFVLVRRSSTVLAHAAPSDDGLAGRLDVAAIDRLELTGVRYTPFASDAVAAVEQGRAGAALLVRAPAVEQVVAIALAGLVMPQKSTYFYPKLLSGLLIAPLDE